MNDGDVIAWHWGTRQPVHFRWTGGKVAALQSTTAAPPASLWLAPALVDLQINGFGGVDYQQDNLKLDDLLWASRQLRAAGCAKYLLTLITDQWPKLMARLRHIRNLRENSQELQQAIAGWHIEGPFLSAEPGFCGAHRREAMCDPKPAHIAELREIAGQDPLLLTLAPERTGAIAAIAQADGLGIKVSLGHTNASETILRDAVAAGATGFTHLGNGCPRELDRHDNILWRTLELPGVKVSLIPDAIHVSPALFRLIHRTLGAGSIYYTTDAMAAAGAPPGRYPLGDLQLDVGPDQIVRLPGKPNFAGSALRPIDGIFRAAAMLGSSWQEAWSGFSAGPSELMGWPAGLEVDAPADFCLLEMTADNRLKSLQTFLRGHAEAGC